MKNHIYILDTNLLESIGTFDMWYRQMPVERRKKIDAFYFLKDKCLSLGAGILVSNQTVQTISCVPCAYARLGKIPESILDEIVEFSPIDCTAKAVVTLAATNSNYTVFHATNGHHVQMGDVLEGFKEIGIDIKAVETEEFMKAFNSAFSDEKDERYTFSAYFLSERG